jgi:hypothetical protein
LEQIRTIIPIFQKYRLPAARQAQFRAFQKACLMGHRQDHFTKKGFFQLVNIGWNMNNQGSHRKRSKLDFIEKANLYFIYKSSGRTKLHIRLRKKFLVGCNRLKKKENVE